MNSGAEAVETAVHIARSATGRQGVVVFDGAYHGRTNLTMAMTSKFSLFKKGFGPFAPEVYRFPFPNTYRRPAGMSVEEYVAWETSRLDHGFTAIVDPSHVAAIVVEPVQGEAGFVPAPAPWLARLRQLADEHGIVLDRRRDPVGHGEDRRVVGDRAQRCGARHDHHRQVAGCGMPISAVVGRPS
jgi:4-aminobutyrate aminotransferase / (S)-3-amino-2-methylpropionate transaminase / 5-aminovalerate transaminase